MGKLSRKLSIAGAAALLVAPLAACNEHASSAVVTPTAASTDYATAEAVPTTTVAPDPRVATSSTADDAAEKARIRAAWHAGKPPKKLIWRVPNKPKSWTELPKTENGKRKWFVKPGCNVILWQLSGARSTKTSRGVLKLLADEHSEAFPGKPKPVYRSESTTMQLGLVAVTNDFSKVEMAESIVDYGKGRSELIAYRNDDLALAYIGSCRTVASFKKVSVSDFDPWLDTLAMEATY